MSDAQPPPRDAFARYLERMAAVGFTPSSVRGQNFLLDPTLHRWIAERAAPTAADTVIEIGVGLGFLTRELASRAGHVVGVEIEPRLLAIAAEDLGPAPHVRWIEGDALGGPGGTLAPAIAAAAAAATGRLLVVANLPYSVSGPVLAELVQTSRLPDRIVVLVQKELGQRLAAGPGSADYGGLSVLLQALYEVRSLRDVAPDVFRPRPKVTSSIVQLDRTAPPGVLADAATRVRFAAFVRALFQQRRKTLRTTLFRAAAAVGGAVPAHAGDLGARAERLGPQEVVSWFMRCSASQPHESNPR